MKFSSKGLVVAVLHLLIVLSLGGKLLYDRATRPRLWVKTESVDPDLPLRGRYFTLNLEVHAPEFARQSPDPSRIAGAGSGPVWLAVENGRLVAHNADLPTHLWVYPPARRRPDEAGADLCILQPGVTFFIGEHAETPRLKPGDELWAEVTVPRKGPPRPIQLAIKHGSEWKPLTYR